MPISQTDGYFENPQYRFLEEPLLFLLALKRILLEKAFSSVKTKTNLLEGATIHFYCLLEESHYSKICTLNT